MEIPISGYHQCTGIAACIVAESAADSANLAGRHQLAWPAVARGTPHEPGPAAAAAAAVAAVAAGPRLPAVETTADEGVGS